MISPERIASLIADHRPFHDEVQIDAFILRRGGGTRWGIYLQALREIVTRWEALKDDAIRSDEIQADIREASAAAVASPTTPDGRRAAIKVKRGQMELDSLVRASADRSRELDRFVAHAERLRGDIGELTPQRRMKLDIELWAHRIKARMAVEFMSHGTLSGETIEMIAAVSGTVRDAVAPYIEAENREELVRWFLSHDPTPQITMEAAADAS